MDSGNITESTSFNHQLRTASITAITSSAQLLKLEYGYNNSADNGNVVTHTITRPLDNGTPGVWTQAYGYDNLNRLTCANETPGSSATPCTSSNPGWQQSYSYDIAGNQWAETPQALPALTGQTPQGYAWFGSTTTTGGIYSGNQNNQVLSSEGWAYDATGNLLSIGTSLGYTYDAESRQVTPTLSGSTTAYGYDGDGRRVTKQTDAGPTAVYVYDAFGNLAAEYPGTSVPAQTTYLIEDALGSTRAEIRSDQVANCIDTLPFGEDLTTSVNSRPSCFASSGWNPGEVRFTGKERDAESGNDYFGARYYASTMGRFMSPDWSAKAEPVPYAKLDNPQSLNLYTYALNNPLRNVDKDGHCDSSANATANTKCQDVQNLHVNDG